MTRRINLENGFHCTSTYVIATERHGDWTISRRQYLDARRRLCGVTGCQCTKISASDEHLWAPLDTRDGAYLEMVAWSSQAHARDMDRAYASLCL